MLVDTLCDFAYFQTNIDAVFDSVFLRRQPGMQRNGMVSVFDYLVAAPSCISAVLERGFSVTSSTL